MLLYANISFKYYFKNGGENLNQDIWTSLFFYTNVLILIIIFLLLVKKDQLKELLTVGLFVATENYTVETLGLHYGFWHYTFNNPGYPEVVVISSLIYFPILGMLFYQYLPSKNNILLIAVFVSYNMLIEIVSLKTTSLFVYGKYINIYIAFIMYLSIYIVLILFKKLYTKLD